MRFVFTGAKFDYLTSSQGGAGPDCSQGRHESCWMVIPSWRTSPTFPAQARGDLSRLTSPLFSRGWNQVFWLVGESWERIPTADWLPGEQQTKLPEFTQRGWVVSCSLSGCQKFCSWVSQPPAPPGCQKFCSNSLVPLLCRGKKGLSAVLWGWCSKTHFNLP